MRFGHRFESRYYQKSTLSEDLIVAWELDETSGTRYPYYGGTEFNLTDVNTVGTGAAPAGIGGLCASFASASNEGLLLSPCPEALRFTGSFTLAAWINPTGVQAINSIFNRWDGSPNTSWVLYYLNTGRIQLSVSSSGTGFVLTQALGVPAGWVLAFGGYDGANIHAAYNDSAESNIPHATGIFAGTSDLMLGKRNIANTQKFDGLMCQCVAWSRWLSASERAYLYNSGDGRPLSDWL